MLPGRVLSRLRPAFGQSQQGLQNASRSVARQFGTALPTARTVLRNPRVHDTLRTRRVGASLIASGYLSAQHPRLLPQTARYASTQPAQPAEVAPATASVTSAPDAAPIDLSSTPIDITSQDILNMPEQIGYLKAMGLDFGWGTTSCMQSLLEHVYIYTGLPWWASIVAVGVLIRVALFWPSLKASESSLKLQELRKNPKYEALRKQSVDFQGADRIKTLQARREVTLWNKAAGVEMWRTAIPLLNLPLVFGFFRLFRAMAELPVPSLETGGILWFTDLAAADPYYIMPIASSAVLFFVMRANLPFMPPEQANVMKMVGYVMTPLTLIFTLNFPAGLQLFLLTTGGLQAAQSWMMFRPWFRRAMGLPPLPEQTTNGPLSAAGTSWQAPRTLNTTATPVSTRFLGDMKQTALKGRDSVTGKLDEYRAKKDIKERMAKAKSYEERRALEEKERYYARLEEQRLRAAERKQRQ